MGSNARSNKRQVYDCHFVSPFFCAVVWGSSTPIDFATITPDITTIEGQPSSVIHRYVGYYRRKIKGGYLSISLEAAESRIFWVFARLFMFLSVSLIILETVGGVKGIRSFSLWSVLSVQLYEFRRLGPRHASALTITLPLGNLSLPTPEAENSSIDPAAFGRSLNSPHLFVGLGPVQLPFLAGGSWCACGSRLKLSYRGNKKGKALETIPLVSASVTGDDFSHGHLQLQHPLR
ncbi:hypothetical protein P167DRAFT_597631 [Morchella conica CCBAS932]|uniref:Uncharacterized protein n=1 Tax=Morchella conica CCBAS932 TaxID=1392247 RepID=A0A3N4KZG7_9PEZI|nr:hypothetical protein P167DRAFT_597631 [Morchella conica CCBAS932]